MKNKTCSALSRGHPDPDLEVGVRERMEKKAKQSKGKQRKWSWSCGRLGKRCVEQVSNWRLVLRDDTWHRWQ